MSENANIAALQSKVAILEARINELNAKTARYDGELSKLNLWHNSRILGHISRIFPKRRSVIFCDSGYFGNNIKYAFLKFADIAKQHDVDCTFLATLPEHREALKQSGLPCLPAVTEFTLNDFYTLLSAKVVVAQDDFTPFTWNPPIPYFFLQGAKLIQLWHGIPLKDITMLRAAPAGQGITSASTGPADVLVAPGKAMKEKWARWIAFREFAALGYPRNDVMMREPTKNELINVDLKMLDELKSAKEAGRKVVFYAPTFRDDSGLAWLEKSGIAEVGQWCSEKSIFFFTKPHPVDRANAQGLAQRMPGVHFADPISDLYPLLRYVDVLVTDYSSLAIDFLLLDRPIVFYRPDHAAYAAKCRNLLPDYERFTTGPIVADANALCRSIEDACSGKDEWMQARASLKQELYDHADANASDRVAELILKTLDTPHEMPSGWAP